MAVNNVNNDQSLPAFVTQQSGASTVQDKATLGKDDFLKLLVTQLQNQDPLNPADNQEFATQLAQFTSLEQLTQMNTSLTANLQSNQQLGQFINNSVATSFIGKDVRAVGDQTYFDGTNNTVIMHNQDTGSVDTRIHITDSQGNEVRVMDLGARPSGITQAAWDGKDTSGKQLSAGLYNFSVEAVDSQGAAVTTESFMTGRVTGVRYSDSKATLLLGNEQVPLENVFDVLDPAAQ